jgi:thiamine-phosphate pyrophosphorylase
MGHRQMNSRSSKFRELPQLYPILDAGALERARVPLLEAGRALYDAGLRWVQYRDKQGSDAEVVNRIRELRRIFSADDSVLLLNDRVHLCADAGADGVHIGQEDMSLTEARRILGAGKLLGVSTHNVAQMRTAVATGVADYLAIGPVFATGSKENPDPEVGLEGVRAARAMTDLPLVAIGGISRETARAVLEAGADAVAVISALLPEGGREMTEAVRELLEHLR